MHRFCSMTHGPRSTIWVTGLCIASIAAGVVLDAAAGASRPPPTLVHQFNYDATARLAVTEIGTHSEDGDVLHDLRFKSPNGDSVPAYLVIPTGQGPFAGVVIQPGSGLGRRSGLPLARMLARHGIATLLSDPPLTRWHHGIVFDVAKDRAFQVETILEARRDIDLLTGRPEVDPHRLGFVGFSAGGFTGALLAGVDHRVKAYILQAVGASSRPLIEKGLFGTPPKGAALTAYIRAAVTPFDPARYVGGAAPAHLFFQAGTADDVFGRASLAALYQAASQPKRIVWYDTDHGHLPGNPKVVADAVTWLKTELHGTA